MTSKLKVVRTLKQAYLNLDAVRKHSKSLLSISYEQINLTSWCGVQANVGVENLAKLTASS